MSHNLKKCLKELQEVIKSKNLNKRKIILEFLAHKNCIYNAMREISINIKKLPLNKKQKSALNRKTKVFKALAKGVKNKAQRKKLIVQTGGFLPWLIPIIASILPTLIDKIIK